MNWVHTLILLLAAYLLVFLQTTVTSLRDLAGAQPDFLPGLMVYVCFTLPLWNLAIFAIAAGLWIDCLSTNPLGVSILPLFLVGLALQRYRGLLLRDELQTQWMLGAVAHALCPFLTVLLLWVIDHDPLIGWFSLWQWFVMTLLGTALTPAWFRLLDTLAHALNYRSADQSAFRPDREIKRGRS